MLNAVAWICARLWLGYTWVCFRTSELAVTDGAKRCLEQTLHADIPTVLLFWNDESLLASVLGRRPELRFPRCTPTDTLGGRVMASAWRSSGIPLTLLPRAFSREQRLRRLERGLRSARMLAMAADSGWPRFAVRPTAWQLARRVEGSRLVGFHIRASRAPTLFGMRVPLPFTRLTVDMRGPLEAADTLEETRTAVDAALRALRDPDLLPPNPAEDPFVAVSTAPSGQSEPAPTQPVTVGAPRRSFSYVTRTEGTP